MPFKERHDEAFDKITELLNDAKNKADYIALDEVVHEFGVRYVDAAFYVRRVMPNKGA